MAKEIRTSYAASQILMEIILDHGMSLKDFEQKTGVKRSQIKDPDAWIPMTSFIKLWKIAINLTGDHALALRLRKKTGMRMVHFVVQLARHSSTLIDTFAHFVRYGKIMSETDKFEISEEDDLIEFTYVNTASEYQIRWLPEHHFSLGIAIGKSLVKNNYNPIRVNFQHADPGYKDVYEEVFRAPVLFQQPKNSVVMHKKDLLQPIASRDPYLQKVLKNYAELSVKKISASISLQAKIEECIISSLPNGVINMKSAAKALNMDRSTLYRQLKMEGTSFRSLLLKTRQEIAKTYLLQGMTNSQVAYLVGFSEPAAFQHAFKRWYKISPGEYRKSSRIRNDH